jgi:hypothetical protein
MAVGLDEVHPFCDTTTVDILLQDAERMLSTDLQMVGPKNAGRIWGFISKFVMLDRFCKTMGLAEMNPGRLVARNLEMFTVDHLGTGSKVLNFLPIFLTYLIRFQILDELNPPTKVLSKFLKTWGDREKIMAQYTMANPYPPSFEGQSSAEVALNLSKRLIAVMNVRNVAQIEAGLEMIALAMAISSEIRNVNLFKSL